MYELYRGERVGSIGVACGVHGVVALCEPRMGRGPWGREGHRFRADAEAVGGPWAEESDSEGGLFDLEGGERGADGLDSDRGNEERCGEDGYVVGSGSGAPLLVDVFGQGSQAPADVGVEGVGLALGGVALGVLQLALEEASSLRRWALDFGAE